MDYIQPMLVRNFDCLKGQPWRACRTRAARALESTALLVHTERLQTTRFH
jgi:hypothetical protein